MNPKHPHQHFLLSLVIFTLACVTLSSPMSNGRATPTVAAPEPLAITTDDPLPTSTIASTATPRPVSKEPGSPPTATVFPEELVHQVKDQTGAIEANVPTVWTDMRTESWKDSQGKTLGTTFTVSTDIEAFLKFQAEGVAISVSRELPVGYTQLLEEEYARYIKKCEDTYKTRWKLEDAIYKGMYFVFGECNQTDNTWLSLFTMVDKDQPGQYVARVVAYDMIPTYGDDFRDMILKLKIFPENIP